MCCFMVCNVVLSWLSVMELRVSCKVCGICFDVVNGFVVDMEMLFFCRVMVMWLLCILGGSVSYIK